MIRSLLIPALVLSASAAEAQRGQRSQNFQGPTILKKAMSATQKLRYIGTRVVEFRRNGELQRHQETITRDGRRLRIEFPEGGRFAGQVIVESGRERRHFFPEKNEIHVLPSRREEAFGRLGRMIANADKYSFGTASGGTIAGLRAEQVVVSDKAGNVLQRLYIEPKSGLILKRSLFDAVGTPVGGFEYLRVDLTPQIDSRIFQMRRQGTRTVTPADLLERLAKEKDFLPVVLAPASGFRLEMSMVRPIANRDVLLQFYRSKSGGRLTLYQLKTNVSPAGVNEFAKKQSLQSYSWFSQGNTFVLVGNVDVKTLERIARQIGG